MNISHWLEPLNNFFLSTNYYKSFKEIPRKIESKLIKLIKSSYSASDGEITNEITCKIDGNSSREGYIDFKKEPEIKCITISKTSLEWVRICLVQLNFPLTQRFPYTLIEKEKNKVKEKVFEAIETAKKEKVNIVIFPELSFTKEWIKEIKNKCKDMIIICGSFYDENSRNICEIIIDGIIYTYAKCNCSIMEEPIGKGMLKGNTVYIFFTRYGIISILTCVDFDEEYVRISRYVKNVFGKQLNFIINPRYDIDNEYKFQIKSSLSIDLSDGSRSPIFILHINTAKAIWGNTIGGGGTAIICYEHKHRIEKYKNEGLRRKDSIDYKICEAKDEMMLIANLKIGSSTERRIEMGNWYRYEGKSWRLLRNKSIWL